MAYELKACSCHPLNLAKLFGGEGYGLKKDQATCTLFFEKHGLKLAVSLAVRKTKTKMDRASQLIFSMIVAGSCTEVISHISCRENNHIYILMNYCNDFR